MLAPWPHCLCGFLRRQELRELRLLQKEEQRAQQQLSNKLQQQREQIYRRFEQETTVSQLFAVSQWCDVFFCIWPTPRKWAASFQSDRKEFNEASCLSHLATTLKQNDTINILYR